MKRDLLSFSLWTTDELTAILDLAASGKKGGLPASTLQGRTAALIFEHASLRTRVSFEVGIAQLGGTSIFLQQETIGLATRESVHDIASVLSRYNDLIIARTTRHTTCLQLGESAGVPVINAMTDLVHPCQVLADALTLREAGRLEPETKIVFLGEGNNIVNSWLELAEKLPLHFVFSCPSGHEPHAQVLEQARNADRSRIESVQDPVEAVRQADVVYTDTWPIPRGSGDEGVELAAFKPYQVNEVLMKEAKPGCIVMHRLPANRGEEITREVLDGPQSVVLDQAENRLHLQKAVMATLVKG